MKWVIADKIEMGRDLVNPCVTIYDILRHYLKKKFSLVSLSVKKVYRINNYYPRTKKIPFLT